MSRTLMVIILVFGTVQTKREKIYVVPKLLNLIEYGNSAPCFSESQLYKSALQNRTVWAHKMFDSSAKHPYGVLRGNNFQLGNYHECMALEGPFPTQYCLVSLILDAPVVNNTNSMYVKLQKPNHFRFQRSDTVLFGLCMPASCSTIDVQNSMMKRLQHMEYLLQSQMAYNILSDGLYCDSQAIPLTFSLPEIFFCTLTVIFVGLVFLGTLADCSKNRERFFMIKCFSAKSSWRFLVRPHEKANQLQIFDSIRTLSVILILLGHKTSLIANGGPLLTGESIKKYEDDLKFLSLVEKISLVVNTYFVMSGLILSYVFLKKTKTGNIKTWMVVLARYMRLTPIHAYVTFYFATLLKFSGSGPTWNIMGLPTATVCQKTWWLNLVYLNNFFIDHTETCNFVTWFISCDFQLFIVGLIVMMLIRRNRRAVYAFLIVLFLTSIAISIGVAHFLHIPPIMGIANDEGHHKYFNLYYQKPYIQAPSYFVGMFGGILYNKLMSSKTKLNKFLSYLLLGGSAILMALGALYRYIFYNTQENFLFEITIYNPFHRLIWSIGGLGVFVVASFGSINVLTSILSSSKWTPLSKLSYGVYLIHFAVLLPGVAATLTPYELKMFDFVATTLMEIYICFAVALTLYIFVEAPMIGIFRAILFPKETAKR